MYYSRTAIFGRRATSQASADDYIDWAVGMLEDGYDSRQLRILAGLQRKLVNRFEAEEHFLGCMRELNLPVPDSSEALLAYACAAAQEIVEGKIPVRLGVRNMYEFCRATDYEEDFVVWAELNDALDLLLEGEYPFPYGATALEPVVFESVTLENFDNLAKLEAENFVRIISKKISDLS